MTCSCLDATDCSLYFQNLKVVHGVVHGPGPQSPQDGPWTGPQRWSMDLGPCFVYVRVRACWIESVVYANGLIRINTTIGDEVKPCEDVSVWRKVMATNDEPRGIQPFDCRGESTSVGPRWRRWRKAFSFTTASCQLLWLILLIFL